MTVDRCRIFTTIATPTTSVVYVYLRPTAVAFVLYKTEAPAANNHFAHTRVSNTYMLSFWTSKVCITIYCITIYNQCINTKILRGKRITFSIIYIHHITIVLYFLEHDEGRFILELTVLSVGHQNRDGQRPTSTFASAILWL